MEAPSSDSLRSILPGLQEDPTISYVPRQSIAAESGASNLKSIALATWSLAGVAPTAPPTPDIASPWPAGSAPNTRIVTPQNAGPSFELVRLVAKGGMGEIWEARQLSLQRSVAVKRIRMDADRPIEFDAWKVHQFRQEALISARLEHPSIVPVHDLGCDESGLPVLAMKLVKGKSWERLILRDWPEQPVDGFLARHLAILADVAQAVAFAHSRGIIHRDIKPAQVMVGEFGEVLLMDWGLGLFCGEETTTPTEAVEALGIATRATASSPSGTPALMAPEQTLSSAHAVGVWTDIYLLGGTLYYLLTGDYPHSARNAELAVEKARTGAVASPTIVAAGRSVPEELDKLCMRCLEREPAARLQNVREFIDSVQAYLSGATRRGESKGISDSVAKNDFTKYTAYREFAGDLERVNQSLLLWPGNPAAPTLREELLRGYSTTALANGDLTLARAQAEALQDSPERVSLLDQIVQEGQRRERQRKMVRAAIAASIVALAVIVAVVSGSLLVVNKKNAVIAGSLKKEEVARQKAEVAQTEATKSRDVAEAELNFASLVLANNLIEQYRHDEAQEMLWRIPEGRRNWEWGYALERACPDLWTIPAQAVKFSPDGRFFLGLNAVGSLSAYSYPSGRLLCDVGGGDPYSESYGSVFEFDEGKGMLLVAVTRGTARAWDTNTWEQKFEIADSANGMQCAAISPAKQLIATGWSDGSIRFFDYQGQPANPGFQIATPEVDAFQIAWLKDRLVAVWPHRVAVWDVDGGALVREYQNHSGESFGGLVTDEAHKQVAVVGANTNAVIMDIDGGHATTLPQRFPGGTFSPDGKQFLHYRPGIVPYLWDVKEKRVRDNSIGALPGESDRCVFSANGENLLVRINATRVQVYLKQQDTWTLVRTIDDQAGNITDIGYLPGDEIIWTAHSKGLTRLWDARKSAKGPLVDGIAPSIDPSGEFAASIRWNWAEFKDLRTSDIIFAGAWNFNLYRGLSIAPDKKRVFAFGMKRDTFNMDITSLDSGKLLRTQTWDDNSPVYFRNNELTRMVRFSSDSQLLQCWDLDSGQLKFDIPLPVDSLTSCSFTPDDKLFMGCTQHGDAVFWDADDGTTKSIILAHKAAITDHLFNKASDSLLTAGADGTVASWELATGKEKWRLTVPNEDVAISLAYDNASGHLLTVPTKGDAIVWQMPGATILCTIPHGGFMESGARFMEQGTRLFGEMTNSARIWDAETGREVVAWSDDFGGMSAKGDKWLLRNSSHSWGLHYVAPWRLDALPGDPTAEWKPRFDAWRRNQFLEWHGRIVRERLPASAGSCRQLSWQTVKEGGGTMISVLFHLYKDLGTNANSETLQELAALSARIYPTIFRDTFKAINIHAYTVLIPQIVESPKLQSGISGLFFSHLFAAGYSGVDEEEFDFATSKEWNPSMHLLDVGRLIVACGHQELGVSIVRRSAAYAMLKGDDTTPHSEYLKQLGMELDMKPPGDLALDGEFPISITKLIRGMEENGETLSKEELATAMDQYEVDANTWLKREAPRPDYESFLALLDKSPLWLPLPMESSMREAATETLDKVERLIYGGHTREEAVDVEMKKFEAAWD